MSYVKAMKHSKNHRKDRFYQPILGMPFEGLKEGDHVESQLHIGLRTAESYHIRIKIDNVWIKISKDYLTEDEATIEAIELDKKYCNTRVYSDKGIHISGW